MKYRKIFVTLVLFSLATFVVSAGEENGSIQEKKDFERNHVHLELEVAMSGLSFRQTEAGSFILQGYLYPKGTLLAGPQSNGVNPDGSPEFPELVIGRWLCKGWSIPLREGQPIAVNSTTTQTYELDLAYPGMDAIHTEGLEYQEFATISPRVILGGTGEYAGIEGQQLQAVIGINPSGGANLQVSFMQKWVIPFKSDPSALTLEEVNREPASQER